MNQTSFSGHTRVLLPTPQERKQRRMRSAIQDLGQVVYYIRSRDDLVKIGYTSDIRYRIGKIGGSWDRLLALTPGTRADEHAVHERFAAHLARGSDWFHPAPELLDHIDSIRERMGTPPITRW